MIKEWFQWFFHTPDMFESPLFWLIYFMGVLLGWMLGSGNKLTVKESNQLRQEKYDIQRRLESALQVIELKNKVLDNENKIV